MSTFRTMKDIYVRIKGNGYLSSLFKCYQTYTRDDIVRLLEGPEEALLAHLEKATELTLHPDLAEDSVEEDPFSVVLGARRRSTSIHARKKGLLFAKPVMPLLRSVTLNVTTEITGAFVDAMEASHFPNLESLAISFLNYNFGPRIPGLVVDELDGLDVDELDGLDVDEMDNGYGRMGVFRLFNSIAAGHLPQLKQLTFVGSYVTSAQYEALLWTAASGNLSALECFTMNVAASVSRRTAAVFRKTAEMKLVEVISSGRLGALRSLALSVTEWKSLANALKEGSLASTKELRIFPQIAGRELYEEDAMAAEVTARALAKGVMPALSLLDMSGNHVGNSGVIALAKGLQACSQVSLKSLFLSNCGIFTSPSHDEGKRGVPALAQLLKSGHLNALEELDLRARDKSCDKSSADALVAAFYENTSLTTLVMLDWTEFPDLERHYRKFRDRNEKCKQVSEGLKDEKMVQASAGKLLLCGHPLVGKTTLRMTLCRSRGSAIFTSETKQRSLPRTRGIEVTKMERSNGVDLVVWDMAGQEEYQLVHNAFLPEFAFAAGEATTFVIVCKTSVELQYWLRFVASSCLGGFAKRHVVVVVNLFDGSASSEDWGIMMKSLSDRFQSYLILHPKSFMVDVRRRKKIKGLRNHLLQHTKEMSRNKSVPGICRTIRTASIAWTKENVRFPVLSWDDYILKVRLFPMNHTVETLRSATEFLHEAGHLIFFRPGSLKEGGNPNRALVVLDPGWFCGKVVGYVVLPEKLLLPEENPIRVERDGSILVSELQRYFTTLSNIRWPSWEFDDFVSILLGVRLCYRVDGVRLLFPARIAKNDVMPGDPWRADSQGYIIDNSQNQWIMGYSLWCGNEITVLPMALFCRLQVELGQNPRFNDGEPNSKYHCGKTYVTFRASHMAVLIYVRPSTKDDYAFEDEVPTFDRVDVLVRPLARAEQDIVDIKIRRECQVDLARAIVEILMELCANICPGVMLVNNVVVPFSSSKSFMSDLEVMEVKKVKELVQKGGLDGYSNYVVNGELVKWEDFLSNKELEEIGVSADEQCNLAKQGVTMGVFPTSVLDILSSSIDSREEALRISVHTTKYEEPASAADGLEDKDIRSEDDEGTSIAAEAFSRTTSSNARLPMGKGSQNLLLRRMSRLEQLVLSKVDQSTLELMKYLHEILRVQQSDGQHFKIALSRLDGVVHRIQAIERFSIEEKERSLPRFMFLAKRNDPSVWMTLKQAIESSSVLHLMCEARYDTQVMHEVEGQDGLDMAESKEWVKKILPWVKISMAAIWFTATTVGNFVAPGMGLLLNSNAQGSISQLSGAIAALTGLSQAELDKQVMVGILHRGAPSKGASSSGEVNVIIRELLGDLKPFQFLEKFGLIKVRYRSSSSVVWICKDCHSKYGSRVSDL